VDDARRWLEHNMKVRVTIRFRGREITYPEIALEDLREIAQSWQMWPSWNNRLRLKGGPCR